MKNIPKSVFMPVAGNLRSFCSFMTFVHGASWHPEDKISDLIFFETKEPIFSTTQAAALQKMLDDLLEKYLVDEVCKINMETQYLWDHVKGLEIAVNAFDGSDTFLVHVNTGNVLTDALLKGERIPNGWNKEFEVMVVEAVIIPNARTISDSALSYFVGNADNALKCFSAEDYETRFKNFTHEQIATMAFKMNH